MGGDAGLEALAKAVELELASSAGAKAVRFRVKVPFPLCSVPCLLPACCILSLKSRLSLHGRACCAC